MLHAALAGLMLVSATAAAEPGKTVWLVQALYPGQDSLVPRCEEALGRLIAPDARGREVLGTKALAQHLEGRRPDLGCLTGDSACRDPADSFVAGLGIERVVLIKAGQEESLYRIQATGFAPATGEVQHAQGAGPQLDRALMSAILKVVPLASSLEVVTAPAGATVYIDGEKVGQTPYSGGVLPGARVLKLELASHLTVERKLNVPARGSLRLEENLQKIPARIRIVAKPDGAEIVLDGQKKGTGKYEDSIQPGSYRLQLAMEGYFPLEEQITIEPGGTLDLERSLTPTGWTAFSDALSAQQENIYRRGNSVLLSYENVSYSGSKLKAGGQLLRATSGPLLDKVLDDRGLQGLSLELATGGRMFGLLVFGAAYLQSPEDWTFQYNDAGTLSSYRGRLRGLVIRAVQPSFRAALWRFSLALQVGFEARVLQILLDDPAPESKFWLSDVMATVQLALRGYIVAGLYLEGAYRHSFAFKGSSPFAGFHVGVGYAY